MKKKIAVLLTAAMVLVASVMPAMAAPSPSTGTTGTPVAGQKSSTTVDHVDSADNYVGYTGTTTGKIVIKPTSAATIQSAVVKVQNLLNDVKAVGNKVGSTTLVSAAGDASKVVTASVLSVVEVYAEEGAVKNADGTYTVTFTVPNVNKGDSIMLLHYTNGSWEEITPMAVGTNQVTAVFRSFSPVAIIKFSTNGGLVSPQTGADMNYIWLIVTIGAAGAVYCGKKYREQ